MSSPIIKVENLGKQYHIGGPTEGYQTIRDTIMNIPKAITRRFRGGHAYQDKTIWALKNVSFEVQQGEVVGIIGKNGAGKTTLLKVLSRITEPTEGYAELRGRVGSLLEVGTGFHPELTGRENVYLSGAILGMRKAEIERKYDEIVAFAELEKFMDTPVKRFSSGMYVRLAFGVAAYLEPEILLVDEVLSVGDAEFQKKCLGKMDNVAKGGRTVLFVSHNMGAVNRLCKRTILLERGKISEIGETRKIVKKYLSSHTLVTGFWECPPYSTSSDVSEIKLLMSRILLQNGQPAAKVDFDKPFQVELKYKVNSPVNGCVLGLQILDNRGRAVLTTWDTDCNDVFSVSRQRGVYSSICKFPAHLIRPGVYSLSIAAHVPNIRILDLYENVLNFEVLDIGCPIDENRTGIVMPILDWELQSE